MDSNRFDTITKLFGQRLSRRSALRGTGAGIASAALASTAAFAAQDGTPAPAGESVPATDVHPDAGADGPTLLMTQTFESGTWEPKDGEEDVYTLTLSGAPAQTIYFSDRPDRVFGTWPTQQFLDNLGFVDDPPNAALVAPNVDSGEEDILIIELLNPQYDASTATLTYDAKVLADYHLDGLSHAATRQQDYQFPQSFEQGGLFIDDYCSDGEITCYQISDGEHEDVGKAAMPECYSWSHASCRECRSQMHVCAEVYPDQCKRFEYDQDKVPPRQTYYLCNIDA